MERWDLRLGSCRLDRLSAVLMLAALGAVLLLDKESGRSPVLVFGWSLESFRLGVTSSLDSGWGISDRDVDWEGLFSVNREERDRLKAFMNL